MQPRDLDPVTADLVRRKARRLACAAGIARHDLEDLEQELVVRLWPKLAGYDPNRLSGPAFVWMVLRHAGANILRDWRVGAHAAVFDPFAGSGTFHDVADPRWHERADVVDLRADVQAALSRLPADLRLLAGLLSNHSVAEAAKLLGVPRTTLYGRIRRLRAALQAAGLQKYL